MWFILSASLLQVREKEHRSKPGRAVFYKAGPGKVVTNSSVLSGTFWKVKDVDVNKGIHRKT